MSAKRTRHVMAALCLAAVILLGVSPALNAETVSVKTNGGDVLQGTLSGLAAMLRLEDPTPPVGPAAQFDIPLSSIQQIWVDFPRVVIETAEHVIVGPYSAFAGIAQLLRVERLGTVTEIPFAAVRQIAFGDEGFRQLPREWLGRNWLNQRLYVVNKTSGTPAVATSTTSVFESEPAAVDTSTESETATEVVWNGAAPVAPATTTTSTSGELPWWVLLVGVALLVAVFFLVPSGSGA
jgi:hypothetical protein